jgi:Fe-S-cluster containining protein
LHTKQTGPKNDKANMNYPKDNPCIECSTNQHCCSRLSGLLLAEEEFEQHFKAHESQLEVIWSDKNAAVSVKQGGPCPHWEIAGCRIYPLRPIDCRVFPYVTTQVIEKRNKIFITFHNRSDCPMKERLHPLIPEAEIRSLLAALGKKTYGASKTIVVRHEDEITSKVLNRIRAALRSQWRKLRHRA